MLPRSSGFAASEAECRGWGRAEQTAPGSTLPSQEVACIRTPSARVWGVGAPEGRSDPRASPGRAGGARSPRVVGGARGAEKTLLYDPIFSNCRGAVDGVTGSSLSIFL